MKTSNPIIWLFLFTFLFTAFGVDNGKDRRQPDTFQGLAFRSLGPGLASGRIGYVMTDLAVDAFISAAVLRRTGRGHITGQKGHGYMSAFATIGNRFKKEILFAVGHGQLKILDLIPVVD